MTEAAEEMRFEQAIEYRELLNSVSRIAERQKITNRTARTKDVIALAMDKGMRWRRSSLSAVES